MSEGHALFEVIAEKLVLRPGVARSTMMGFPCLRVDGDYFVSVHRDGGSLIVKLSREQVAEAVSAGDGEPFAPAGRVFREWLAIPVALWIGAAGIALARENIGLLMGEAPSAERQAELLELAQGIPGVLAAHSLRARYQGTEIEIWVQVAVDEGLTVRAAHDIGEAVQRQLEAEPDVCHAVAHVDVA